MSDAMEDVIRAAPVVDSSGNKDEKVSQESTPVPDVQALETLYIQNLNENIKIDGPYDCLLERIHLLMIC